MSAPLSVRGTLALVVQVILSVGIVILVAVEVSSYKNTGGIIVADPTKPFDPEQSGKSPYWDMLVHSPLAMVIAGLFVALAVITLLRTRHMQKKFGEFGSSLWPLVVTAVIGGIGFAGVAPVLASPSSADTFSTWAKERYGIEIEDYPSARNGIKTDETVTLDNGEKIEFREVIDARGNRAYVITNPFGRHELPRVDSEAPKPPSPDTQRQLDDRRDMKQSAGDDSTE